MTADNGNSNIEKSLIVNNAGDGICYEGDLGLSVESMNILNNSGLGVNNLNPAAVINAQENWWGDPTGAEAGGVNGNVDFSNWRTSPVALVVTAGPDTIYIPAGQTDSVTCCLLYTSPSPRD